MVNSVGSSVQMNQSVTGAGSDKHELMKLLLTLNEGVRALGSRFDAYQA